MVWRDSAKTLTRQVFEQDTSRVQGLNSSATIKEKAILNEHRVRMQGNGQSKPLFQRNDEGSGAFVTRYRRMYLTQFSVYVELTHRHTFIHHA